VAALGYGVAVLGLVGLRFVDPIGTTVQLQRSLEARCKGVDYTRHYQFVPLEHISRNLQHAVVAAEDSRFFGHHGIDWEELSKVPRERRRRLRGASTITEQLVKNLFFTTHRSVLRKLLELPLVLAAEAVLPKRRILELYLNVVEWGPGVFGAEAAARYHFGVPAAQLTRDEAARLAACLPAPRTRRPQHMDRYSAVILKRMQRMGW
jgi:monofunctional biosynthetic peptidoglycan transglycosylase